MNAIATFCAKIAVRQPFNASAGKINNSSLNFADRISATLQTQPRHNICARGFSNPPLDAGKVLLTIY